MGRQKVPTKIAQIRLKYMLEKTFDNEILQNPEK